MPVDIDYTRGMYGAKTSFIHLSITDAVSATFNFYVGHNRKHASFVLRHENGTTLCEIKSICPRKWAEIYEKVLIVRPDFSPRRWKKLRDLVDTILIDQNL